MSFSYNPYNHIDIMNTPGEAAHKLHCHGCGKTWEVGNANTIVAHFFTEMARHISSSHKRSPEDFKTWSDE